MLGPLYVAGRVLCTISRAAAALQEADPGSLHGLLLQELSVTICRHRVRAALRHAELHSQGSQPTETQRQAALLLEHRRC